MDVSKKRTTGAKLIEDEVFAINYSTYLEPLSETRNISKRTRHFLFPKKL